MAKINWIFTNQTTSNVFTSSVVSANYMYLRQSYKDYFAGANLVITLKNQNNQSAGFNLNDVIFLNNVDAGSNDCWKQNFYVSEIEFDDAPGNIGFSTATIVCQDFLARAARVLGGGQALPSTNSLTQLEYFSNGSGYTGPLPSGMFISASTGTSTSPAVSWTESVINKIQINQLTENASMVLVNQRCDLYGRKNSILSTAKFGPLAAANTLIYNSFKRIRAGQSLINNVDTQSTLGTVNAFSTSSQTTYGQYAEQVTSADSTLTQQLGLSEWRANSQANPLSTRFEFSVLDIANNMTILDAFILNFKAFSSRFYTLTYRVPGDAADTVTKVRIEGINLQMNISNTLLTFFCSPYDYYGEFLLDNANFGLLDTDRLGW